MQALYAFGSAILVILFNDAAVHVNALANRNPIWNETWTDKLKRDLLVNYDKFARPAQHSNVTNVTFDFNLHHVTVNEFKSTVTVNAWVSYKWTDEKLRWDPEKYGGLAFLHTGSHEIWQPDIILYNGATSNTVEQYGDTHCIVSNDGQVIWVPPAHLIALCELDLRLWPFDTQNCTLIFGSWTYSGEHIDIQLKTGKKEVDSYFINGEWNLLEMKARRQSTHYVCCEEPYISVELSLLIKRNSVLYYSLLMTPATAVVFLTLITFWLPPQSEMKVTTAACTALIITVFLVYFGLKIPMTCKPPLIVYFYSGCLCQVTISLIVAVLVINMSRRHYCKPLPRSIRLLLLSWPGRLLGLSDLITVIESKRPIPGQELRGKLADEATTTNSTSNISDDGDHQNIIAPTKNTTQLEWVLAATAVDRVTFIFFCIALGTLAIVCLS